MNAAAAAGVSRLDPERFRERSGNWRIVSARRLRDEGFAVQREGDESLVQPRPGRRSALLMLSHIDTVPACDGWSGDPFKPAIRDGR